jgi:hypothetical protein
MSPAWNRTTFRSSCRGAGWRVTRVLGKQPTVVIKDLSDSGLAKLLESLQLDLRVAVSDMGVTGCSECTVQSTGPGYWIVNLNPAHPHAQPTGQKGGCPSSALAWSAQAHSVSTASGPPRRDRTFGRKFGGPPPGGGRRAPAHTEWPATCGLILQGPRGCRPKGLLLRVHAKEAR